ncbi:phage tail protein [Verrucosispora sp. TAA-831]|uniref:phage tail protein n=1 Tax=Verrucosispora sp. TAA-831 TaxID=3422227 RepID=UPI003D6FEE09
MTSPVTVGHVAVEITASAKGFAQRLRRAVIAEFKSSGLDKALAQAIGDKPIKVRVQAEFDRRSLPRTLPGTIPAPRTTREDRTAPDTDLLMRAFRDDVQRQIRALSRLAIKIPVTAETDELRSDIGRRIGEVQRKLTITIPTQPAPRREYERNLRDQLADVTARVQGAVPPVKVPVKPDPVTRAFQADIQRQINALAKTTAVKIPVNADTSTVHAEIAAQIAAVERTLKAEIPTEPGSWLLYQARVRAMLAATERTVKLNIPVDIDRNRFQQAVAGLSARLPTALGAALQRIGDQASAAGTAIGNAMSAAANSLLAVVQPATLVAGAVGVALIAFLTIGPVAAAAATTIGVLAGALAALPALTVGVGASIAAIVMGVRGLGEAFKSSGRAMGGGGASAASSARQIAAAERSISAAHRNLAAAERTYRSALAESLRATRAIDDARKAATRRIEDLGRAARGAALDERDAALRIKEAEKALSEAFRSRNPLEIERAVLELEQAQFAYEGAIQAGRDAADAKVEADRKGVESSDEVVAALERQQAANDRLLSAADGLQSAQDSLTAANEQLAAAQEKSGGSAGGLAKQMTKLAPSAERFVAAVKALGPAFGDLRLEVQQRLFEGLDRTVTRVGTAWLPQLRKTLGDYAGTLNGFFRDLGNNISKPDFIKNIAAGAESVRGMIEKIGKAVSGPLVDAFGRLAEKAQPFIDTLGDKLAGLVDRFSEWIISADKSGKLEEFFHTASGFLQDVSRFGKDTARILKGITAILFGADNDGKGTGFLDAMDRLADWLNDPENQRQAKDWLNTMKEIGRVLWDYVVVPLTTLAGWASTTSGIYNWFALDMPGAFGAAKGAVGDWYDTTAEKLGLFVDDVSDGISTFAESFGPGIDEALRRAAEFTDERLTVMTRRWRQLKSDVVTALADFGERVSRPIREGINRAIEWLRDLPERGARAVSGLPGRIRSALSGLRADMHRIGRDVVFGLIDGITSLGSWLSGRIRSFAWGVIRDFQSGFQIGSPSKLMSKEVGRWLPPGLAAGMDGAIGVVREARDRLIAAAIPEVDDAYRFDITPVADTASLTSTVALAAPAGQVVDVALRFEGDAPDSFFGWVADNVRIRYGGDANRAFGRASTPELAGAR